MESQELSPFADIKTFSNLANNSQITDSTCSRCVGMMVGSNTVVDSTLLDRSPRLRLVLRHGIGFDNIDIEYAGRLGIIVCNVPNYGVEEVADTAMAHILALFRQTTYMHTAVLEGKQLNGYEDYCTTAKSARRVRGKILGLIGLGKTGIAVALRARVFGFHVIFYDPYTSHGLDKAIGGLERYSSVGDLISKSDCVSLHCMLTKETKHMINANMFKLFKRGSFLVNVSRGTLVEEDALAKALKEGRLGGAALDVHEHEPFSYHESPLKEAPNLICTPHIAWYSKESYMELRSSAIQTMKLALNSVQGVNIQDCVNSEFLDKEACQNRWCTTEPETPEVEDKPPTTIPTSTQEDSML